MKQLPEETAFQNVLDGQYDWPDFYSFKFICSQLNKNDIMEKLKEIEGIEKLEILPSAKENYFSIHFRVFVINSLIIVEIYKKLSKIEGVIKI